MPTIQDAGTFRYDATDREKRDNPACKECALLDHWAGCLHVLPNCPEREKLIEATR